MSENVEVAVPSTSGCKAAKIEYLEKATSLFEELRGIQMEMKNESCDKALMNTEGFSELLVEAVEQHPVIYDHHLKVYRNNIRRSQEWQAVAQELNDKGFPCSGEDCRRKFAYLIRCFKSEKAARKHPTGSRRHKPFSLFEKMGFLNSVFRNSTRINSLARSSSPESAEDADVSLLSDNAASPVSSHSRKRKPSDAIVEELHEVKRKLKNVDEAEKKLQWFDHRWTDIFQPICFMSKNIPDARLERIKQTVAPHIFALVANELREPR